jgi:hypothetical protein
VTVCAYIPTFTRSVVLTRIMRVPVVMRSGAHETGVLRKAEGVVRERRGVVPTESEQRPKVSAVVLKESGVAIRDAARTSEARQVKPVASRKPRTSPVQTPLPESQTLN